MPCKRHARNSDPVAGNDQVLVEAVSGLGRVTLGSHSAAAEDSTGRRGGRSGTAKEVGGVSD
jgi:hypothetical protein